MFVHFVTALDWFGTAVFAVTGALVAARRGMDIFGFAALAVATGIGGGTIRDVVLGLTPVTWVKQPEYLRICLACAILTYFAAHWADRREKLLDWLDAVGLSLFCVVGAQRAFDIGAALPIAVLMGITTATFGGIIRNILAGEIPVLLHREVYPAAAFAGAATYALAHLVGAPIELSGPAGFAACFLVRGGALLFGWQLPAYRPRRRDAADL